MDIPPPLPSPSLSSFIKYVLLDKEYYVNERYRYYNDKSIVGILDEDTFNRIKCLDIDLRLKIKVIYFLTMLVRKNAGEKGAELKTEICRNTFGIRDWKAICNICKKEGFIEVDENYKPGEFCRKYKLIKKSGKKMIFRYWDSRKTFGFLKNTLDLVFEKINNKNINHKISKHYRSVLSKIELPKNYIDLIPWDDDKKVKSYRLGCENILTKNYSIRLNEENGRWTNSVTNLPKTIRRELTYNGQKFIELDYSAMQPWMATLLYPENCLEKEEYIKLLKSGEFYEKLASKSGYDFTAPEKRKPFKKRVMREVFFGKQIDKLPHYKVWGVFSMDFPVLSKILLKNRTECSRKFALRLQKMESDIVIGQVLNVLADKGIPSLTVHDSIMCLNKDASLVTELMRHYFKAKIGHEPGIQKKS
jgi:hypothetical protein